VYPVSWAWGIDVEVVARCSCHYCGHSRVAVMFAGLSELQLADIVWLPTLFLTIIITG
jgi:hypothetical protein